MRGEVEKKGRGRIEGAYHGRVGDRFFFNGITTSSVGEGTKFILI